ncbi:MAG: shikimate dehydrogenase [Planctomycetia bacterium]|nr:shikimate dehydrogenase [Planctomycetia bacterium]
MSLICVTLACDDPATLRARHAALVHEGCGLVEYRLDFLSQPFDVAHIVAGRPGPIIVTVRRPEDGGRWTAAEETRRDILRAAVAAGAEYVDFEPDAAQAIPRSGTTRRIVSMHDFKTMPSDLAAIHAKLAACDADVVKLAVMAERATDVFRVLRLMRDVNANSKAATVGLCMGELGLPSRVMGARYGAPFSYSAPSAVEAVAPGQIGFLQMRDLYRYESITADTPFYGVIGDPIGHSRSPAIHNAALADADLDGCYVPFRVPPADLAAFLAEAPEFGVRGISVTIPHKEAALRRATKLDPATEAIGAVNTLVFEPEGETLGYNTDEPGAMESLEAAAGAEGSLAGKRALVLGAGGAAKGIVYGLLRRGVVTTVTNRNPERAEELAKSLGCRTVDWDARSEVEYDILVNCTPLGMYPKIDDTPLAKDYLRPGAIVFDTVYNPAETRLLREAKERGSKIVVGTEMFLRQAAWQFRYFTGTHAPLEVMRAALKD